MPGVLVPHQDRALALRGERVDPGEVGAHRLANGRVAGASAGEALADQVALADQPDDHAASLDRDRPDLLLRHELRGLAADDVPDHVPLDGGHARAPCATGSTLSNCEPGVKLL